MNPKSSTGLTHPARPAVFLEGLFTAAFVSALFFFLTSGFPLMQLGWIPFASAKNNYGAIAVSILFIVMALLYWKAPQALAGFAVMRFFTRLASKPPRTLALIFFIPYILLYSGMSAARQHALDTRAFDLGIFSQAVWNTTQGAWLFSSIKENTNLLGDHFSPILLLLAPIYAVFSSPITLLWIQVFAAATALFFIAKIAWEKTGSRFFTLTLLLIYFFYTPTRGALHEDFHPEMLAEPFLFGAFLALERKKIWPLLACLVVSLSTKENMNGIAFMMGFYALIFKKWHGTGIFLMAASVALFLFEVKWLIPQIGGRPYLYQGFYLHLLKGPAAWAALLGLDTWEYLLKVFIPLLFLPLFHFPILMLTFPILAQNILSANDVFRSFAFHYQTGLTPFLFAGAAFGFASLKTRFPQMVRFQTPVIGLLLFLGLIRSGPSEYTFIYKSMQNINAQTRLMRSQLELIPKTAVVLTHNNVIPQVCHRKHVYQFEYNGTPTKLDQAKKYGADYAIFYDRYWEAGTMSWEETLAGFRGEGYKPHFEMPGFAIYKKDGIS